MEREPAVTSKRRLGVSLATVAALAALALAATASFAAAGPSGAAQARAQGSQKVLAAQLAAARAATAKYVWNLNRAKADGYMIITKMIPNMGYHFLNPKVKGFDVRKPAILVYEHRGTTWQLGAIEWVYTAKPSSPPLPGATYGTFGAGCHYKDGTYVPADSQDACPKTAPGSGAAFNFWHPLLYTMHLWLWYPNPSGLFSGTNPLVAPYNAG
jgi:hypothetical protein